METSVVRDTYVSSSIMEIYFSLEKEVEFYIFEEATEWNVRRCSRVSAVNILPYTDVYTGCGIEAKEREPSKVHKGVT